MRITEDSSSRIVMRESTMWISVLSGLAACALAIAVWAMQGDSKALIIAGLFGLFAFAFFRDSNVIFDKVARTCTLRRLVMWNVTHSTIGFDEIDNVLIDVFMSGQSSNIVTCRLSLSTTHGNVPLTGTFEPGMARFEEMRRLLVATIFDGRQAPPKFDVVRTLIAEARRTDAIHVLRQRDGLDFGEANAEVDRIEQDMIAAKAAARPLQTWL